MKVLIGYYSKTGNTRKMAQAIAQGVKKAGMAVDLRSINRIRPADLLNYQAIIFGSPTYYGLMAAAMKKLIDDSVQFHGALSGKIGGAFTSSGGIGGGGETAILGILESFLIHGMIIIGEADAYHYAPLSIGSPNQKVLKVCKRYGQKIAILTEKIFKE